MQATITGATQVKSSQLGCALDVDLDTGKSIKGGTPTDDTAVLQKFLSTASATNPIVLVMDGAALITGLQLSAAGYTTILGSGDSTGFFLKSGSNNDGIHNRPANYTVDPGPPAPPRTAAQVTLKSFRLNGNRGDGRNGNSTSGNTRGGPQWLFGINLMDMEQITIDQVTVLHASTYSIRLSNVGHALVTRCKIMPFSPIEQVEATNTDGVHVNGPSNDIEVSHCYFRTGDDGIALNAPEGHGGTIERVTASNCVFDQCQLVMRIYSGSRSPYQVKDVTATGLSGSANVLAFLLGLDDRSAPLPVKDALSNILIQNCQITSNYAIAIEDNVADLTVRDFTWISGDSVPGGMIAFINHNITVDSLTLNKVTIKQTPAGHRAVMVIDMQDNNDFTSYLGTLTVDGLACVNDEGVSGSLRSLIRLGDKSSVGSIVITAVDSRKIANIVWDPSEWSRVGNVGGTGLLQSGWAVHDRKVLAGTRYISEETMQPTEMVGDVPHTLTITAK